MNESGTGATFRERWNWALLGTTILAYGVVVILTLSDPLNAVRTAFLLLGAVLAQVIALVGVAIVLALTSPSEPDDERDLLIALRSTRYSHWILGGGALLAVLALIGQQFIHDVGGGSSFWASPLLVGHFLMVSFLGAEVVRVSTRAFDYRRGS